MKNFKFFDNLKTKFAELKKKNKRLFFVTFALCLVAIILVVSCVFSLFKTGSSASGSTTTENTSTSTSYAEYLQNKLEKMILMLDEVDEVSVLVTVSSSEIYEYLKEVTEESSTDGESSSVKSSESVVLQKDGSSQSPVLVSVTNPEVLGVMIVLNKISSMTKISIISSVAVVLNIDESCISILQES